MNNLTIEAIMKIKKLAILSVCMAAVACTTDSTDDITGGTTPSKSALKVVASSEADTRVEVSEEGLQFDFKVEHEDRIGLNLIADGQTDSNISFKADSQTEAGWVNFVQEGNSSIDAGSVTSVQAYYPYDAAVTFDGSKATFEIPAVQTQAAAGDFSHLAKYYVMAAKPTEVGFDAEGNPNVSLRFSGIFSLVRIRLVNETAEPVTVYQVDMKTRQSAKFLVGKVYADLSGDPSLSNSEYVKGGDYSNSTPMTSTEKSAAMTLSVKLAEPAVIEAGGEAVVYAVVASHTSVMGCTLTAWTTDGYKFTESKTKDAAGATLKFDLPRDTRTKFKFTLSEGSKVSAATQPDTDQDGAYLISNLAELLWVAENAGVAGNVYKLDADIDLSGATVSPIGTYSAPFAGKFYGDGHTISNVELSGGSAQGVTSTTCIGLFGATAEGAVIDGLNVSGISYVNNSGSKELKWIGGLVGYAQAGTVVSNVNISGVNIEAVVDNDWQSYRIGGVVGFMAGEGAGVSSYSNISADGVSITGAYALGGFAGSIAQNADIENCTVKNVTINHKGQNRDSGSERPETDGYIYASAPYIGDVAGAVTVNITGENIVGGQNSREDLDGFGYMNKTLRDIQPYVGELDDAATVNLNGSELSRTVTPASESEFIETLLERGGEVVVSSDLDFSTMAGYYLPVQYPTVLTIEEGTTIKVDVNQLRNYSDLTLQGGGTISGVRGIVRNEGGGDVVLNGITLKSSDYTTGSVVYSNGGSITIEDCNIEAAFYALGLENTDVTINGGTFKSTSHNGNKNDAGISCWAYCVSIGGDAEAVINDGVFEGVQGAVAAIDGANLTINGGTFQTYYNENGVNNNFYALYVANEATATVNNGKFYTEGTRVCVCIGNNDVPTNTGGVTYLKGGYYEDMGNNTLTGQTISPAAGYKFVELAEPLVEGRNTYYYQVVAE